MGYDLNVLRELNSKEKAEKAFQIRKKLNKQLEGAPGVTPELISHLFKKEWEQVEQWTTFDTGYDISGNGSIMEFLAWFGIKDYDPYATYLLGEAHVKDAYVAMGHHIAEENNYCAMFFAEILRELLSARPVKLYID